MRDVSDHDFRQALRGYTDLSRLPMEIASQIRAMWARMQRVAARAAKRETKSIQYAQAGLNGKRAVARRLRQREAIETKRRVAGNVAYYAAQVSL